MIKRAVAQPNFQLLFERGPSLSLVLLPDFTIIGVSDAYLKATLTDRETLLGQSIFEAFPDDPNDPSANGVKNLRASLERVLERKTPDTMPEQKYAIQRPPSLGGGFEERYWSPRNCPILSGSGEVLYLIHQVEDITQQVKLRRLRDQEGARAEKARATKLARVETARDHAEAQVVEEAHLREEAQRKAAELEAVISSIPDAVYIGDATGIKRVNKTALEQLGFETEAELQRNIPTLAERIRTRSFTSGAELTWEEQPFVQALHGKPTTSEVVIRHLKSGADLILRSSAAPIEVGGRVVGAVAVNVDITDAKRQQTNAQQQIQFEKQLIGIVSHDLRSPISAIILGSQTLLRQQHLDEPQTQAVQRIEAAAERTRRMISDLLDFTKARIGGGLKVVRILMDLRELAQQTIEEVKVSHPDREIRLEAPETVSGEWDPDRMAQVMTNLLRNALTYSFPATQVTVSLACEVHTASLTVHNHGTPIPAEKMPQIFEPLQRATTLAEGHQRSIGLGLYIVNAIVRGHGGTIEVHSSAEQGTTFAIRLPRHP